VFTSHVRRFSNYEDVSYDLCIVFHQVYERYGSKCFVINGVCCEGVCVGDQLELQPGAGPQHGQEQPGPRRTVQGGDLNNLFSLH